MIHVGISIGVFVGIISGIIVLAIVRTMSRASIKDADSVKTLIIQLFSLVSIVAGASFLVQSGIFTEEGLSDVVEGYFLALAITFTILIAYPLFKWVYSLGEEFGKGAGN